MAKELSRSDLLGLLASRSPLWIDPDRLAQAGIRILKGTAYALEGIVLFRISETGWRKHRVFKVLALDTITGNVLAIPGSFSTQYAGQKFIRQLAMAGLEQPVTYPPNSTLEEQSFSLSSVINEREAHEKARHI